ncbi:MAG: hypothetical protein HYU64_15915 [Armatimonadetes bacterium]|nr:hypothetical protein [Armatimonadota bacterium]
MAHTVTFPLTEFSSRFGYVYLHHLYSSDGGQGDVGCIYSGHAGQFINRASAVLLDDSDVLLLRDTDKNGAIDTGDMEISSKELKKMLAELPENGTISGKELADQGYLALRRNPGKSNYVVLDQTSYPNNEVGWLEGKQNDYWIIQSIQNSPSGPVAVLEVEEHFIKP